MLEIALLGSGRMGAIHAANIAGHPEAQLRTIVSTILPQARELAERYGGDVTDDADAAFADAAAGAVVIATPTNTHVDFSIAAARAGKAILCEKPIDLDLARVDACVEEVERAGVPFMIGFNRRFDPNFRSLREALVRGEVGLVEALTITSRDPEPPPIDYVRISGGIFRDMTIHDFDMARWLLGEEPTVIFATGSCMVDPAIAEAGDVDTTMVVMRTASGALCHIANSRRAVYGYDQRIEVSGAEGVLHAGNRTASSLTKWSEDGVLADRPLHFFAERYEESYRAELDRFIAAATSGEQPAEAASVADGRRAMVLAETAVESMRTGRPVEVPF